MIRPISSLMTFFYKFIFSSLWIAGFGMGTVSLWLGKMRDKFGNQPPANDQWLFLVMWITGSLFIYWGCVRLKRVRLDDKTLYISNYLEEIRVPLENVASVSENRWINIHPVTFTFKNETRFGSSVVFMPRVRLFSFFSSHPIVSEIREAIKRAEK